MNGHVTHDDVISASAARGCWVSWLPSSVEEHRWLWLYAAELPS